MGLPALQSCSSVPVQPLPEGGCWVQEEAVSLAAVMGGGGGSWPISQWGPR